MSTVIYPSEKDLSGPWLLDTNQLNKLDELIENQMKGLEKYRDNIIDDRFEKLKNQNNISFLKYTDEELLNRVKKDYDIQRFSKELTVRFKSDKTILANSFKEIAMNKEFENDLPKIFTYNIECVDIKAEITNDLWSDNKIRFKVNTLSIKEANELFFEFDNWLKQVSPPLYVKLWKWFGPWIMPLFLIILIIIPSSKISTRDRLKTEAHQLLKDGINNEEISKGVEILLSLETNYEIEKSDTPEYEWNIKSILFIIILGFLLVVFTYPPRSIIGICKGEKKLKRWRAWIFIVTYIVPAMIILPILINLITNKL